MSRFTSGSSREPSSRGRWIRSALLALLALAIVRCFGPGDVGVALAQDEPRESATDSGPIRFEAVDVFVDTGDAPLAAWQVEVSGAGPTVTVSGVEGGEHLAFSEPPYHDTEALTKTGRLIVAAFHIGDELPTGRTRVARLHFMVEGAGVVRYTARLVVAGGADGKRVTAQASAELAKENGR
jgi:hypothetical protein